MKRTLLWKRAKRGSGSINFSFWYDWQKPHIPDYCKDLLTTKKIK